jgi:hypothetical protein
MERASAGQASTHVSQSTHISWSTFAFSLSMAMADAGHSLTQVSHPVHFVLSTMATNSFTPGICLKGKQKKGFYCIIISIGVLNMVKHGILKNPLISGSQTGRNNKTGNAAGNKSLQSGQIHSRRGQIDRGKLMLNRELLVK